PGISLHRGLVHGGKGVGAGRFLEQGKKLSDRTKNEGDAAQGRETAPFSGSGGVHHAGKSRCSALISLNASRASVNLTSARQRDGATGPHQKTGSREQARVRKKRAASPATRAS